MKKNYIILILILTLLFVSCTMENEDNGEEELNVSVEDSEIVERSEAISDIVVEQFGIDDAVTIIFNENALIAVKIAYDEDITQEHIADITKKAKEYDELIEEVFVTDDSNTFREIDDIVFGLLQGDAYNDFLDDINEINNRLSNSSS